MQINLSENFGKKHIKTIEQNYKKKPFYTEVIPFIEEFYNSQEPLISKRNIHFIKRISEQMQILAPQIISSEHSFDKSSTELLIQISKFAKADVYLAGGGAKNYQEDEKFSVAGIEVLYQNFKHPIYNQHNNLPFTSGLSIIDALMNIGFEETAKLLEDAFLQPQTP